MHFSWEPELKSFPLDAARKTFVVTDDFDEEDELPDEAFGGEQTRALLSLRTCTTGDTSFEASLEPGATGPAGRHGREERLGFGGLQRASYERGLKV